MSEIKNFDVYNTRMKKTLLDKVWWLTLINDNITIVIDYGCADGALYEVINNLFPKKFTYIGIDNSNIMLNLAKEKYKHNEQCMFFSSLNDLNQEYSDIGDKSVLVLNSVIHEFYSWLTIEQNMMIRSDIEQLNPKYIAIRDMINLNYPIDKDFDVPMIKSKIKNSAYTNVYEDWLTSKSATATPSAPNTIAFFTEFFLKYQYKENWKRERDEVYLWTWYYELGYIMNKYYIDYKETFNIKYIVDCIKRDFNINWSKYHTHMKLMLTRA